MKKYCGKYIESSKPAESIQVDTAFLSDYLATDKKYQLIKGDHFMKYVSFK